MSDSETPAQRRRRLRGMTEDEQLREEDRAFYKTFGLLTAIEQYVEPLAAQNQLLRDRLTPNQLQKKPRGGPGTSIIEVGVLEATVDKMRRNSTPFQSRNLAKASGYGRNTILRWSKKNPGEYSRLRARWHGAKTGQ